jgi:uncharacterized protein YgbK (DUF1537 family)
VSERPPGEVVVVLDDDPTGTQAVSGVPVLTQWADDDLRWAFRQPAPAVFLSLNTRSLAPADARARVIEATSGALRAAAAERREPVFASRSDSTLRGHFPLETDAVQEALGAVDGVVVVPAFLDSGRITVDSVHYVVGPDGRVPAAESEFARDRTFGYRSSDLCEWVEEKTAGRWRAADVARITLDEIRADRIDAVLEGLSDGRPVVVDAESEDDLLRVAEAVRRIEAAGRTFVYRVGPSFVRARAGLGPAARLDADALREIQARHATPAHGLVVVGSHVAMTTEQLERVRGLDGVAFVEVDAEALLDDGAREGAIEAAAAEVAAALERSEVVVHTSRTLLTGDDAGASLAMARSISGALVELVRRIVGRTMPRWVIAKGGITSSDVGAYGLGIRRAWVRGSLLASGVSLWEPADADAPVLFVVFPGNVGGPDGLRQAVLALRGAS